MGRLHTALKCTLIMIVLSMVQSCRVDPTKFKRFTMEQMLEKADVVAYGQLDHLEDRNGVYTLYCILKNNDPDQPLPETVTLEVLDRSSASCTLPPDDVTGGVDVLMLLTRQDDGTIIWHDLPELLPPTRVTFNATAENLNKAVQLAGFQNPVTPEGRDSNTEPKCPEVGTFDPNDDQQDSGSRTLMSFIWGIFFITLFINAGSLISWFTRL